MSIYTPCFSSVSAFLHHHYHHSLIPVSFSFSFPYHNTIPSNLSQPTAMQLITSLVVAAILVTNVAAHPGHDIRAEMAERAAFMQTSRRDLSHCASKMKARGLDKLNVARRAAVAKQARKKRGIATGMCPVIPSYEAVLLTT
jgi:hypothetical protein